MDKTFIKFKAGIPENSNPIGKIIDALPSAEAISWENQPSSVFCQYPQVEAGEYLYRQMIDPIHWNNISNEFTPGAFQDVHTHGLSVNRFKHTNLEALVANAEHRIAQSNQQNPSNEKRKLLGFIKFNCGELRNVKLDFEEGRLRVFIVIDTALENDPSHADVFGVSNCTRSRAVRQNIRRILFDLGRKGLLGVDGEPRL